MIDMADGNADGLPEQIVESTYYIPWFNLIEKGINDIHANRSSIREYGGTNNAEFFAVVSEYFFERPKLLKHKHPDLYKSLQMFFKQNRADVQRGLRVRKKAPCPCGSGKRYKHCCMPKSDN